MSKPSSNRRKDPVLDATPGEPSLMLGNEAIVRGALEAGIAAATTYPGTPSSEIGDTFSRIAHRAGIFFEYSANEKIALEVGAGAALSGARTLVSFKHVGLNVALEALVPLAYTGIRGGLVVISAGDPGCHSSLTEQDNRHLVRLANLPCIEPATPEEARRWTIRAFEMSEEYELPVLIRTTTRIAHMKGIVEPAPLPEPGSPAGFEKNPGRFVTIPPASLERHGVLISQMEEIGEEIEAGDAFREMGRGELGIVSSGVSRNYVEDAVEELELDDRARRLEMTVTYPLPERAIARFLERVERVLVVEELDPVLEDELRRILGGQLVDPQERDVEIVGKSADGLSRTGEYNPALVKRAVAEFFGCEVEEGPAVTVDDTPEIPNRPPALCAGCPHRATYFALKDVAGADAIYAGDIGCYTLGALPPFQMQDTVLCMGASMGLGSGFAEMNDRPAVSIIGDSTFFHAGIPGLVDALRNGRDLTIAVLDNRTTAMTGHQPHPGSDHDTGGGRLSVASVATGLGVEKVEVVDPMDLPQITEKTQECVEYPGVAVLVCREPCPLYDRKAHGESDEQAVYRVDPGRCKSCGFKSQGLHCGAPICDSTELWRSDRKVQELPASDLDHDPTRMDVPPCGAACPVNICAHGYVAYVAGGDYAAALRTIRERNPLPSVCSYVCHEPCEDVCIRAESDEPVAINRLKRFVCEWAEEHPEEIDVPEPARQLDERVAVVGSGPAGLACAHDLALRGYQVVVFEQMDEPGGLLRYGIPPYRLPSEILERDLDWIRDLGVEFRCGVQVGSNGSFSGLLDEEFDAVCLATGAWKPRMPEALSDEISGVRNALGFLQGVNRGEETDHDDGRLDGERIVILGAGNTGVDAGRVALRLGAEEVVLVEQADRESCTAIPEELEAAEAEGVEVLFGMTLEDVETGDEGAERVRLVPTGDGEAEGTSMPADLVLVAIGQQLDGEGVEPELLEGDWMQADEETKGTALPGVFAAGDSVAGPGMVIDVLAEGKRAAHGIDRYLSKGEREVEPLAFHDPEKYRDQARYQPNDPSPSPRVAPEAPTPNEAIGGFGPTEQTLTEQAAQSEAERCFACGTCANCNVCIDHFACVALYKGDDGKIKVNESLCNGCGVCAQICPNNAFERVVL